MSFLIASVMLKLDKSEEETTSAATAAMEALKGKKSVASSCLVGAAGSGSRPETRSNRVRLRRRDGLVRDGCVGAPQKIHSAGPGDVTVVNKAISNLTDTYDLVVTHQDLTERAQPKTPSAIHVSVDNFMNSPRYDEIVELIDQSSGGTGAPVAEADAGCGGRHPPGELDHPGWRGQGP